MMQSETPRDDDDDDRDARVESYGSGENHDDDVESHRIHAIHPFIYPVRKMTCTPESVSTTPLISPTPNAYVASSNARCIAPRPNSPKSPPLFADEQSDTSRATSSNAHVPFSITAR